MGLCGRHRRERRRRDAALASRRDQAGAVALAEDENIWKRRTAILAQLKCKDATDANLLEAVIAPSIGEKEFFLRKGIGWALRNYSYVRPTFVIDYVQQHAERLSPLTKREALKALLKAGTVARVP